MIERNKLKLDISIPFNDGSQEGYEYGWCELVQNHIFKDTLFYKGFGRGRSSIKFDFENKEGKKFEMFASDFSELVSDEDISKGVTGEWSFVKRGQNYGIVKVIG